MAPLILVDYSFFQDEEYEEGYHQVENDCQGKNGLVKILLKVHEKKLMLRIQ